VDLAGIVMRLLPRLPDLREGLRTVFLILFVMNYAYYVLAFSISNLILVGKCC
jgi:hypothetical protein